MASSRPARLAAVLLLVLLPLGSPAEERPALAGAWKLNHEQSDDIEARMKESAGAAHMSGGPSWATETWLPWGTDFGEGQRIEVRKFLLATVPVLQDLELEVSPNEIKTIHGEAGVRIFNLTRASAGSSAMTGAKVERRARWQGDELVLDTRGKDSKLAEVVSLVPPGNQLQHVLRLEAKVLEKPLEVRLVYDRVVPRDR